MTLSIIIVKYRSEKYLPQCLASIKRRKECEVIIIDNDKENIGYGPACNQGAKKAKGKFLFFLNPDTVVQPFAIERLVKFFKDRQNAGIVAPLLLDKNKKVYPLQGTGELTPLAAIFALSFINKYWSNNPVSRKYWLSDWNKKEAREVNVVPGTALMIRREIFEKISGFDENFFLYFEESDLCKRVREAGWKIFFEPEAGVIHFWRGRERKGEENKRIFRESRYYFFKKHYGLLAALLVEIFLRIFEK